MKVTRSGQGKPYEAAKHHGCWGAQYVTAEDGARTLTINVSHFLPGGGAEMSSSGMERVYFVLEGSVKVQGKTEEYDLAEGDSIFIAPGEERSISINGQAPAKLLVVIAKFSR